MGVGCTLRERPDYASKADAVTRPPVERLEGIGETIGRALGGKQNEASG